MGSEENFTLSKGKYKEFHPNDTIVQIGTVMLNTITGEVVAFVDVDTVYSEVTLKPELVSRWMSPDPLADEYPEWSPYTFTADNPILYVDPDGREFIIWYKNDKGKDASFRFDGTNASQAPQNEFVQQFLSAYQYNIDNGGGEVLQSIATNGDLKIGITTTEEGSQHYTGNIYWNPEGGSEYSNGTVASPATILEHEADHANQRATNYKQYREDRNTKDVNYTNLEEKRVILGSEQKTARANGEVSAGQFTRKAHEGNLVVTDGPTSNKVNRSATYRYYQKLDKQGYNVDKQLNRYAPK